MFRTDSDTIEGALIDGGAGGQSATKMTTTATGKGTDTDTYRQSGTSGPLCTSAVAGNSKFSQIGHLCWAPREAAITTGKAHAHDPNQFEHIGRLIIESLAV